MTRESILRDSHLIAPIVRLQCNDALKISGSLSFRTVVVNSQEGITYI